MKDSLLDQLTEGVAVLEVLNVELAGVEERRADLVLLLADGTILHIEFQSANDKDMPYREGIYCLLLGQKYRRRVRQVVLYLGQPKMRMEDRVDLGETKSAYRLMDIREMDARRLMASGRPGDLVLAMLAGGGPESVVEIAKRAGGLRGAERQGVLVPIGAAFGVAPANGTPQNGDDEYGIINGLLQERICHGRYAPCKRKNAAGNAGHEIRQAA